MYAFNLLMSIAMRKLLNKEKSDESVILLLGKLNIEQTRFDHCTRVQIILDTITNKKRDLHIIIIYTFSFKFSQFPFSSATLLCQLFMSSPIFITRF